MKLEQGFAQFYDEIELGAVPEGKIASAWNRLQRYLVEKLGLSATDVFLQGSYANGTAVAPPNSGGQYDLDVVVVAAANGASADDALGELEAVLAEDGDYAKRIKPKKPCVRLDYAADEEGRFHVDVVPARPNSVALEIPFRGNGWHETNPAGYTQWCLSQPERFHRTVRMLKRWRDENQDERRGVKSIVLQVLIHEQLVDGSDAESITGTLENLLAYLEGYPNSPPVVLNPSLTSENLADRWPDEHYQAFRREIRDAAGLARQALDEEDPAKSHALWQKLLGSDFPGPTITPRQVPPPPPPPGHSARPQRAPERERYG
jgi:predicted nucleotidyltransferase